MISRIIKKTVELSKVQKVDQLEGPLYQLENGGHTFDITCLMDGAAADVSGTVSARFLRQDEVTVYFTGTLSGNVASITLPQSCYNVNGRFGLVVFVAGNDITTAIYAVAGSVYRSTSDHIIDPTEEIPSLEDLIAQIDACEDATIAATAAAAFVPNTIATAYSASATYAVGDYCTKDGYMYRCNTAISAAEAWTAAHWTQVTAGAELGDVKSAVDYETALVSAAEKIDIPVIWGQGGFNDDGSAQSTTYKIRTGWIDLISGDIVAIADLKYTLQIFIFNQDGTFNTKSNLTQLYIADSNIHCRIVMQRVNPMYSITTSEGSAILFLHNTNSEVPKVKELQTETAELYTNADLLAFNGAYSFPASYYARGRYVSGYPTYDITYRANMPNVVRLGYDAVITPVDNSFRVQVLLYNANDTFVSLEELTGASSIPQNQGFRLSILRRQENTREVADLYEFARAVEISTYMTSSATGEKYIHQVVPFAEYKIDSKLYKMGSSYKSLINPRDNYVRIANGVTVYMAVNGDDTNDGLSSAHPKKTFASAVAVQNVQTIILAEGTYEAGTHFSNGEQITVPLNLIGVGNVVIKNGHFSTPITFTNTLYCENITFYWGNNTIIVQYDSYDKVATFYKCRFEKSGVNNGLYALGGLTYVIECEAVNNSSDGFNYHKYNTILNHAIEINCKSSFNGDGNNYSSNATTTHNGNYIVRVNGDYKCCYGGVVADQEAYSANYGCSTGISTITDATNYADRMSNYWCSSSVMYLFDCVSYGSLYDTATIGTGEIVSNVTYPSNYTD